MFVAIGTILLVNVTALAPALAIVAAYWLMAPALGFTVAPLQIWIWAQALWTCIAVCAFVYEWRKDR